MSREPDRSDREDEIRFLEEHEQRPLAIADEVESAGLGAASRTVLRAAERLAELKMRLLERG